MILKFRTDFSKGSKSSSRLSLSIIGTNMHSCTSDVGLQDFREDLTVTVVDALVRVLRPVRVPRDFTNDD